MITSDLIKATKKSVIIKEAYDTGYKQGNKEHDEEFKRK